MMGRRGRAVTRFLLRPRWNIRAAFDLTGWTRGLLTRSQQLRILAVEAGVAYPSS
jgi:hypothetical protein